MWTAYRMASQYSADTKNSIMSIVPVRPMEYMRMSGRRANRLPSRQANPDSKAETYQPAQRRKLRAKPDRHLSAHGVESTAMDRPSRRGRDTHWSAPYERWRRRRVAQMREPGRVQLHSSTFFPLFHLVLSPPRRTENRQTQRFRVPLLDFNNKGFCWKNTTRASISRV